MTGSSYNTQRSAVVTGASSGLGLAIKRVLLRKGWDVFNASPMAHADDMGPFEDGGQWLPCDVRNPVGCADSAEQLRKLMPPALLVNCAGVNGIDYLEDMTVDLWDEVMNVNARGIFLMTKAFLPDLKRFNGTVLNIISNASHMPMTSSLAYNASKGAAHIMTLQLARELTRRHGVTVFGISPNKLKGTGMSKQIEDNVCRVRGWTPEYAAKYQQDALLAGEETDPRVLAEFIGFLLDIKENHKYLTGCVLPYGA
jgi:NAD(P)-dependent dehydrogenase (short-subunit alcohol dehydrogenase family)